MSYRKTESTELLKIIEKYTHIVNTRKNDPPTALNKRKAWIRITNEYNRLPNVRPRLVKQVKKFYENLKSRKTKAIEPMPNDVSYEQRVEFDGGQNVQDDSNQSGLSLDGNANDSESNTELHLLKSAIDALRAKMEENKCHQRKLHQLSVQREQLQIKMLEQEIEHKANLHTLQIQRDHELHQMRKEHERELHKRKLRHQDELHQKKLNEIQNNKLTF